VTKLGRLVKDGKIKSLEQIYLYAIPIKEFQIVDYFLGTKLKDEVMVIKPVQKQTAAGQRTRFKAVVVVGDSDGHLGLGSKVASEVANAIRAAINVAKLNVIPIRRGYWGNKIGKPHTISSRVTGKCGSVLIKLVPAPRGTGLVASPTVKKILQFAGIQDAFTKSNGHTKTVQNTSYATFHACAQAYKFLSPDLWADAPLKKAPFQEHSEFLAKSDKTRKR